MKQKINIRNPKTGKRQCACLDIETGRAHTSNGDEWSLTYLESKDPNGVGFFETCKLGKVVQKIGKFIK